jgi:DNA primase large subunit
MQSYPYLPILPFLIKYPFLKLAGLFLKEEYTNLLRILKSKKALEVEAKEIGKDIVLSVLQKKFKRVELPELGFVCSACDKNCRSFCEEGVFSVTEAIKTRNKRDWRKCKLCGNCFKHCSYDGKDIYPALKFQAKKFCLAYLFSRILVSCLEDWVRKRYAIKEAKRYVKLLEREDKSHLNDLLGIFSADFGIDARIDESVSIHVSAYLKGASRIKAEKWRLVNRKLKGGYVELTKTDFIRLIEEYVRERLEERLDISKEVKAAVASYLREIGAISSKEKEKFVEVRFERVDASCFPPCIKKILLDLKSGFNIPHSARFALTAFLLNIGLDVEEVMNLFRTAPDFNEEKTRYQVEHIAGAKGTEYDCPACDTMRTYHNCYANESCAKTYHPISYYEWRMRRKAKKAYKQKKAEK